MAFLDAKTVWCDNSHLARNAPFEYGLFLDLKTAINEALKIQVNGLLTAAMQEVW